MNESFVSLRTLYHGTTTNALHAIKEAGGLDNPCLTSSREVADYYAECEVDESGGDKCILEVTVEECMLKADYPSFQEPLTYFRDEHATSDTEWHEALEAGSEIRWPADTDDWQTSLEVVWSVRVDGKVCLESIQIESIEDKLETDGATFGI